MAPLLGRRNFPGLMMRIEEEGRLDTYLSVLAHNVRALGIQLTDLDTGLSKDSNLSKVLSAVEDIEPQLTHNKTKIQAGATIEEILLMLIPGVKFFSQIHQVRKNMGMMLSPFEPTTKPPDESTFLAVSGWLPIHCNENDFLEHIEKVEGLLAATRAEILHFQSVMLPVLRELTLPMDRSADDPELGISPDLRARYVALRLKERFHEAMRVEMGGGGRG